jgi:hypothetical protein
LDMLRGLKKDRSERSMSCEAQQRGATGTILKLNSIDQQPFDDFTLPEMLLDNVIDILFIYICIPRRFGINDQHRTIFATAQATRKVGPHTTRPGQPSLFDLLLGIIAHLASIESGTTGFARFALVGAKKQMVFIKRHG